MALRGNHDGERDADAPAGLRCARMRGELGLFLARTTLAIALVGLVGCGQATSGDEEQPPESLLRAAILAHGGEARMTALGSLRIVGDGVHGGRDPFRRIMQFGSRERWSMTVTFDRAALTVGMDGEGGWESQEHMVRVDDEVATSPRGLTTMLAPLRLLELAERPLRDAGTQEVAGREVRAVESGEITILLDSETKRLVGIRYPEEMVETFSRFEPYAGVVLPRQRSLSRGSEPDVEERIVEIGPEADDAGPTARPPAIHDGMIIDEILPAGSTAWTEVAGGWREIEAARQALEAFARRREAECCREAHLSLTPLGTSPPRWRVAIHLTAFELVEERTEGALHLDNHSAAHVVGRFHAGGFSAALQQAGALDALVSQRGYTPGSRLRVFCYRTPDDRPDCDGVTLLVMDVTER